MIYIDLKNVAGYFNEYFVYILVGVLLAEFLLGTTRVVYANSLIEIPLRIIGWISIKTFRMRHKKLDKKKGRRL